MNIGVFKDEIGGYSLEEICSHFDKVIEIDPNNADAYYERAVAKYKNDSLATFKELIRDYSKAIDLNKDYWKAYGNRGNVFRKSISRKYNLSEFLEEGQTLEQQAESDFNNALRINPKDDFSCFNKGQLYLETGQFENAIPEFSSSLELNPKDADAYNDRGWAKLNCKPPLLNEAKLDFGMALSINRLHHQALGNLSLVKRRLGGN